MRDYSIAVFMTFYNRKEKTLNCVKKVFEAENRSKYNCAIELFACDDGSTDGTADELRNLNLPVHIVQGSGNLFWARGMAKAIKSAEKYDCDFYLMVNDDVDFNLDFLDIMLDSYESVSDQMCAVVGSTKDNISGEFTYGGLQWNGKAIKEVTVPVPPSSPCKTCNKTNWNCFFIPRKLYETVGDLDDYYEHSWADFDYSLRLTKMGYKIYVANDYIGLCTRNSTKGTWGDKELSVKERLKAINKKTGLPPKSSWHFCKKFYGLAAPYVFIRPYLSILKAGITKRK